MSFCSNYQACTLSQKISIGLVVDSALSKRGCGSTKGADDKEASKAPHSMADHNGNVDQGVRASTPANNCKHDVTASRPAITIEVQPNNMANRSKEALRMKLCEVLGMDASANDKTGSSRIFQVGSNEMRQDQVLQGDPYFKRRQNSDTIETDSENVSVTIKRPVTRSFSRKRAPGSTQPRNSKPKSLSCSKEEKQGVKIFSFAEKSVPSQPCTVNRGCFMTERSNIVKRSCGIKPGDMLLPLRDFKNIQPVITASKKPPPVEVSRLNSVTTSPPHGSFDENVEPGVPVQNVKFNHPPVVRDKDQPRDAEKPVSPEKLEHNDFFGTQSPAPRNDGLNIPLFNRANTAFNSHICLSPLNNDKEQHLNESRQAAKLSNSEDKCLFKSSPATEKENSVFSNDSDTPEDIPASTQDSSREDKDVGSGLFTPDGEESDSTEEVSSAKKVYSKDIHISSEIGLIEKPMFFRNKRHCSHDVDYDDVSPTSATPKGGSTDDVLTESFERSEADGFTRIISLLGLGLEKVKNKMTLATNKRCLEILMSAAEEIHSQLQNVESQIHTDLGKLTSLKTSKRKYLETRLQEQQENLKVIHGNFKEEIHKYLQDCRSAMEGLETQHVELKGAIERQKALHSELLFQVEAAVETHLIDAQRQIVSVHKSGKQKMRQLKVAIAECLKDGISG